MKKMLVLLAAFSAVNSNANAPNSHENVDVIALAKLIIYGNETVTKVQKIVNGGLKDYVKQINKANKPFVKLNYGVKLIQEFTSPLQKTASILDTVMTLLLQIPGLGSTLKPLTNLTKRFSGMAELMSDTVNIMNQAVEDLKAKQSESTKQVDLAIPDDLEIDVSM